MLGFQIPVYNSRLQAFRTTRERERFAADGTESDTTYQNLIRISAFHSEAPGARVTDHARATNHLPEVAPDAGRVRLAAGRTKPDLYRTSHRAREAQQVATKLSPVSFGASNLWGCAPLAHLMASVGWGSGPRKLRLVESFPTVCGDRRGDAGEASSGRPRDRPTEDT